MQYYSDVGRMQRIYIRINKKFIPIGWYCKKCKNIKLDKNKLCIQKTPGPGN